MNHIDHGTMRGVVELASRAPSVHNSQPWRWVLGARTIHVYADTSRWLPVTDPDRRDLIVSCGAALHHLRIALAASGSGSTVDRFPDPHSPQHVAAVELHRSDVREQDVELASAIARRRTDRRRFTAWDVPAGFLAELTEHAAEQGALLRPVTGPARTVLIDAIREAARAQENDPAYRTETALWSGWSTGTDGVPAANLLRDPVGTGAGTARRYAEGTIEQPDTGEDDGAVLLVLGTASDDRLSQLRAGEALSAVLLHATVLGLATCPLSQPLEIGSTRLVLLDQVLGGTIAPQLVLRVGWAPDGHPPPPTPRRPISECIEPLR